MPVIPTPPFADAGLTAGVPLDAFAERGALTVDDRLFLNLGRISAANTGGVIFHEFVHCAQFAVLCSGARRARPSRPLPFHHPML